MTDTLNKLVDLLQNEDALDSQPIMENVVDEVENDQIALLLEALPIDQRLRRWNEIPADLQPAVMIEMRGEVRASLIRNLSEEEFIPLLSGLDALELIELADSLPESMIESALVRMDAEQRAYFDKSNQYLEEQIGRYVDHELIILPASIRVGSAFKRIPQNLPAYTDSLFLIDKAGAYCGTIALNSLYLKPENTLLKQLIDPEAEIITADTDIGVAADSVVSSERAALPVVDDKNHLLGRVTIRDAMQIQRTSFEAQMMAKVGMNEEEDLFAPVVRSSLRRATWLGINLVTAFLASWAIGLFEATIQQVVALAVLMPIVASMGGIAGSQTLTLMIRGLALNQITNSNLKRLLIKELGVGTINGLVWAVVIAIAAFYWFDSVLISFVIGTAIAVNILVAMFAGVLIPMALEKLRLDPALSGSVILTTVTDLVGFITFLGLGTLLLT